MMMALSVSLQYNAHCVHTISTTYACARKMKKEKKKTQKLKSKQIEYVKKAILMHKKRMHFIVCYRKLVRHIRT